MYEFYCRLYQTMFRMAAYVLPWRRPELLQGENSLQKLPALIKKKGIERVLIVTDKGLSALGLMEGFLSGLRDAGIGFFIYDRTVPNPTVDNIEEALGLYTSEGCQGIVAFGGGSPLDCAKGVGARLARPHKTMSQLRGTLKIRKAIPPLFAVPTTAGTGSETTLTAVITDSATKEKYPVNDLALIPHVAVLDPVLTLKLPPSLTATTGMDALSHAVEAYIGRSNTRETKDYSKRAIALIFENLYKAYADGADLEARSRMLQASHEAGLAFTRAYVGNIHAIAHTLGALYSIPHGLANAVLMPYVLEYYGPAAQGPLAELADWAGLTAAGDSTADKAAKFIAAIKELNRVMQIPDHIEGIAEQDLDAIAARAYREANPFYPVPKILSKMEFVKIVQMIRKEEEATE
ncbi:MAG TPA: iron-containing alcohol dehydrogenase [Desulfitobacterium dehalogenans]|uniref:Iron-containing alcohol dehydrogenase n=1 Tax=Desulfitobacterium dehalogenans TaxID=36854 RepID=A0A7C6Z738_9FIRM|nr:iron-containing alcohol dehydrogenase [Desulfitobacterium dehalogenans]